jgi:mannose/fructose/N-acetylgalactosamine-specific phosphotransferase system component IIC
MKISRIEIRRSGIQRLLQVSGALIILGLLVELASLMWFHPLSFVLFAFVSVPLIGLGVLVYLVSLVFVSTPPAGNSNSA